jgi:hypothetical protein
MTKALAMIIAVGITLGFSSCWISAEGRKHKLEVGAHRVKNDEKKK